MTNESSSFWVLSDIGDGSGLEPWHLTTIEDVNLQAGWLLVFVLIIASVWSLQRWWPYSFCKPQPQDVCEEACGHFQMKLYKVLWGCDAASVCVDCFVLAMGLSNFLLFAVGTEAQVSTEWHAPAWLPSLSRSFQVFTMLATMLIILCRLFSLGAHPAYSRYGSGAWLRYLLSDFFVHVDICSMLPSIFWLSSGQWHLNLLWLSLMRTFEMVARRNQAGEGWPAMNTIWSLIDEEHSLLVVMCLYSFIPWFLFSGLYFVANRQNEETQWDAVEYQGISWQRFQSIPSSMFFVMINLCAEEPLAGDFERFHQRLLIVIVCLFGVPIWGLPTGVLGASFRRLAHSECEPGGAEKAIESEASSEEIAEFTRSFSQPKMLSAVATGFLSFFSVIAYFYYTAGPTHLLAIPIHVTGAALFAVDSFTTVIFFFEWLARLVHQRGAYVKSFIGSIDCFSWLFGSIHALFFLTGIPANDWVLAACVLRVFKLERYTGAFHDMFSILRTHAEILKATCVITFFIWISFSSLLFLTENSSTDADIRENYASVARALWSELINLHGEWVWCDYSAFGKALCTIIGLFSIGLFIVPIIIFGEGYQARLEKYNSVEGNDTQVVAPWQSRYYPTRPGIQRTLYDLLYSHLAPVPRTYSAAYLSMCTASVVLTLLATTSTILLTMARFSPPKCEDNPDCSHAAWFVVRHRYVAIVWFFFAIDVVSTAFFIVEFCLRVGALRWRYPCSFIGVCDMISLTGFCLTLSPLRARAFFPDFSVAPYCFIGSSLAIVPARLLRLINLESYVPSLFSLSRVFSLNRVPLLKSGYALVCIWYVFGTMLYLFEHDGEPGEDGELSMADRYKDVLTGLQYALVHITGDYPITEYTLPSKFAHFFALMFGMCVIAAFTGIFSAGFIEYLKQQRELNSRALQFPPDQPNSRPEIILRRMSTSIGWCESPSSLNSRESPLRGLRTNMKQFLDGGTFSGRMFTSIAHGALILNLLGTLLDSIPESDDNDTIDRVLEINEYTTGSIFVLEYCLHLAAADNIRRAMMNSIVDALCLLPTFARFWVDMAQGSWRHASAYDLATNVILCCAIFRVVRILNFPYIRPHREQIWIAIKRSLQNLAAPSVLAVTVWVLIASLLVWVEKAYHGPEEENVQSIPDALFWTAIYFTGEWANVDFSPGAGSRICILICLFGVALVAIPIGLVMEAVGNVMDESAKKKKMLRLQTRSSVASLPS